MRADRATPASRRSCRLISILIPVYNAEDILDEQLDALKARSAHTLCLWATSAVRGPSAGQREVKQATALSWPSR